MSALRDCESGAVRDFRNFAPTLYRSWDDTLISGSAQQALSECRDRELTVGRHGLSVFVGVVLDELLDVRERALGGRIGEIRLQV